MRGALRSSEISTSVGSAREEKAKANIVSLEVEQKSPRMKTGLTLVSGSNEKWKNKLQLGCLKCVCVCVHTCGVCAYACVHMCVYISLHMA